MGIVLMLAGCGGQVAQPSTPPAADGSATAAATEPVPQAEPEPAAEPGPAADSKNCCNDKCSEDETVRWQTCDGSDLAKKVADEWQGLLTGYKYERGAADEALRTAKVYVPKAGPAIQKSCGGPAGQPDCLIVYTDETAARHSCEVSDPVAVPFSDIAKRAKENGQWVNIGCLQFFKTVQPEQLDQYLK